jgi:hypothetical protein
LIQCGNEKRREKERKKFTNSYELQKIQGEIILQLGSLGNFQVNSLTVTQFFDALKLDKSKLIKENHNNLFFKMNFQMLHQMFALTKYAQWPIFTENRN